MVVATPGDRSAADSAIRTSKEGGAGAVVAGRPPRDPLGERVVRTRLLGLLGLLGWALAAGLGERCLLACTFLSRAASSPRSQ